MNRQTNVSKSTTAISLPFFILLMFSIFLKRVCSSRNPNGTSLESWFPNFLELSAFLCDNVTIVKYNNLFSRGDVNILLYDTRAAYVYIYRVTTSLHSLNLRVSVLYAILVCTSPAGRLTSLTRRNVRGAVEQALFEETRAHL